MHRLRVAPGRILHAWVQLIWCCILATWHLPRVCKAGCGASLLLCTAAMPLYGPCSSKDVLIWVCRAHCPDDVRLQACLLTRPFSMSRCCLLADQSLSGYGEAGCKILPALLMGWVCTDTGARVSKLCTGRCDKSRAWKTYRHAWGSGMSGTRDMC